MFPEYQRDTPRMLRRRHLEAGCDSVALVQPGGLI